MQGHAGEVRIKHVIFVQNMETFSSNLHKMNGQAPGLADRVSLAHGDLQYTLKGVSTTIKNHFRTSLVIFNNQYVTKLLMSTSLYVT